MPCWHGSSLPGVQPRVLPGVSRGCRSKFWKYPGLPTRGCRAPENEILWLNTRGSSKYPGLPLRFKKYPGLPIFWKLMVKNRWGGGKATKSPGSWYSISRDALNFFKPMTPFEPPWDDGFIRDIGQNRKIRPFSAKFRCNDNQMSFLTLYKQSLRFRREVPHRRDKLEIETLSQQLHVDLG